MFQASEFVGRMFDWYAVDKDGQIASFVSAWGLIPNAVFSDEDAYKAAIKFFEGRTGVTIASVFEQWRRIAAKNKLDERPAWAAREAGKGLFAYSGRRRSAISGAGCYLGQRTIPRAWPRRNATPTPSSGCLPKNIFQSRPAQSGSMIRSRRLSSSVLRPARISSNS